MSARISDWKWACIAAVPLTGLALVVVFRINPGGFEGQIVWLLLLLPASLAAYPVADYAHTVVPHAERVVFWISEVGFNFVWYWGISYAVIRILRFLDAP